MWHSDHFVYHWILMKIIQFCWLRIFLSDYNRTWFIRISLLSTICGKEQKQSFDSSVSARELFNCLYKFIVSCLHLYKRPYMWCWLITFLSFHMTMTFVAVTLCLMYGGRILDYHPGPLSFLSSHFSLLGCRRVYFRCGSFNMTTPYNQYRNCP